MRTYPALALVTAAALAFACSRKEQLRKACEEQTSADLDRAVAVCKIAVEKLGETAEAANLKQRLEAFLEEKAKADQAANAERDAERQLGEFRSTLTEKFKAFIENAASNGETTVELAAYFGTAEMFGAVPERKVPDVHGLVVGTIGFKGRDLPAGYAKLMLPMVNRRAGEKKWACFYLAIAYDAEFKMLREITSASSCTDKDKEGLVRWVESSGFRLLGGSKHWPSIAAALEKDQTPNNAAAAPPQPGDGSTGEGAASNQVLTGWLSAQNSGDFDAYSKLYAADFQGVKNVGGQKRHFDRQGWLNDRKGMFANSFSVEASDAKVDDKDGTQVITFTQTWRSSNYGDRGTKVLHVRDGKVVREEQLTSAPLGAISIGPFSAAEWDSAEMVNTQGASSRPAGCDMRTKGDWVRVVCSGVLGHEQASNLGAKGEDYFLDIESSGKATLVVKMRQGPQQTVRLCRKDERASLLVSWPSAKPRPVHIALGKGPACDGSDWGAKN